ncbi:uncharacterized protein MELLADRAFT_115854 [Melampsora larici-populina 98AG31]|uniref:Uncharacterized protein n=1 Tax=Melampsora larici-populina (strain 98AG31 / pathotype 3-4-7) TaxID=747676 RepID=F4REX4_MELLP|nr:uncharacterized protein MELLADRAFT_115854 [Melampsora larici-populina 98AG31]EGG09182.1 hypothetical protein MELLADRAFT_115854 [Melampsora larici-populina 98AG31]
MASIAIYPEPDSQVEVIMTPPHNPELVLEIPKPILNSRYTAHFMEYKSAIQNVDQDSPTRSRYHDRRAHTHTTGSTSSDGSPQSGFTDEISSAETLLCDGMLFLRDDLVSPIPDLLHSMEKNYPRYGHARYIIESDTTFTMWSRRGWLNLDASTWSDTSESTFFVVWPVYAYVNRFAKMDLQTRAMMRKSGLTHWSVNIS